MDERNAAAGTDLARPATVEELDEEAAGQARDRYRTSGLAPLTADQGLAELLRPGERVFALHGDVTARCRPLDAGSVDAATAVGTLLLTSARIVVAGTGVVDVDLEDIEEAVISGDRLLLVLRHGTGLSLELAQPRLLRVQVAAARSVTRGPGARDAGGGSSPTRPSRRG